MPEQNTSGERLWRSRPDIKKEQAFGKWVYAESDRERCGCTPGEAGEKELGFVHNAVKCECDTCRYCYACQDDEVKWSEDKLRTFMDEDCSIKLGEGDFRYTKAQLEKMLRKKKVERESARVFTAAVTVATGGEVQGIEDSVSPPASKELETKIDDAPRNSKELHAHEEYEELVKSGKLEIKQLLDMGVFVLPSDDQMEEIRSKNKRTLRCVSTHTESCRLQLAALRTIVSRMRCSEWAAGLSLTVTRRRAAIGVFTQDG